MSDLPTGNIPSKSPAIDGDLGAAIAFILRKFLQKVDGQLPAEVISYNRATNRATVKPLVSIIGTNGQRLGRAPIAAVPVLAIGGGNFFMNFPLGPGDIGWIEASDRDISLFLQNAQQASPFDGRLHSFEHGRFIPDAFDRYTYTLDADALVISSYDGSTRIVMSQGKISLIAPDLQLNGQTVEINAATSVTINTGAYNINTTGTGTNVSGTVTLPNSTTIAGRDFLGHGHKGVQTGTGDSGGVV
jgi:hypothetical protein